MILFYNNFCGKRETHTCTTKESKRVKGNTERWISYITRDVLKYDVFVLSSMKWSPLILRQMLKALGRTYFNGIYINHINISKHCTVAQDSQNNVSYFILYVSEYFASYQKIFNKKIIHFERLRMYCKDKFKLKRKM